MDEKDKSLAIILVCILACIAGLWLITISQSISLTNQNKMIRELQEENEYLSSELSFVEDTYNEQIIMLDSQCTLLEAEILELREELEDAKK